MKRVRLVGQFRPLAHECSPGRSDALVHLDLVQPVDEMARPKYLCDASCSRISISMSLINAVLDASGGVTHDFCLVGM